MALRKAGKTNPKTRKATRTAALPPARKPAELVIITGMSGSGKASVLKAFEDLGYYCVDNLPLGLFQSFADILLRAGEIERAALVADVREGSQLKQLPGVIQSLKRQLPTTVV